MTEKETLAGTVWRNVSVLFLKLKKTKTKKQKISGLTWNKCLMRLQMYAFSGHSGCFKDTWTS